MALSLIQIKGKTFRELVFDGMPVAVRGAIAVGIGLGSLLGLLIRNMGAGICFGVGLGMLLGFLIDIILEKI